MYRIFVVIIALVVLWPGQHVHAQESVVISSGEWPPFFSNHLPGGGLGNRIVTEAFAEVGVTVDFDYLPWKRAYESADRGPAQGSSGWLKLPERERRFLFSDPIFHSARVFFHRKDSHFHWETPEDMKDYRIAVTLGSADEIDLESIMASGKGSMDIAISYEAGMKKLAAGRVDAYFCNVDVGRYILHKRVPEEMVRAITFDTKPFYEEDNHLIISRRLENAQELMTRFNEGLDRLRESGRYARIRREFFAELDR